MPTPPNANRRATYIFPFYLYRGLCQLFLDLPQLTHGMAQYEDQLKEFVEHYMTVKETLDSFPDVWVRGIPKRASDEVRSLLEDAEPAILRDVVEVVIMRNPTYARDLAVRMAWLAVRTASGKGPLASETVDAQAAVLRSSPLALAAIAQRDRSALKEALPSSAYRALGLARTLNTTHWTWLEALAVLCSERRTTSDAEGTLCLKAAQVLVGLLKAIHSRPETHTHRRVRSVGPTAMRPLVL